MNCEDNDFSRRRFIAAATAAAAGVGMTLSRTRTAMGATAEKPALLGGKRVRTRPLGTSWPKMDKLEDESLLKVLRSGRWFRGGGEEVNKFERAYAQMTGAKHCVATANGTAALVASLGALGIGPGDEVIVPPYTFIATVTSVLMHYALPVFVDTDPETFLMDPRKIEAAITDRTAAILPVHIGGSVADLDAILAIAAKRKLPVVEDACQAHLAEWKGRKAGTWGTTGCFSFQVTKNLCSGEGGAILTADAELAQKCYAFHNNCRARQVSGLNFTYQGARAQNLRMTEFQGALLQAQMTRVEAQSRTRSENAKYLTTLLHDIPGIQPAKMYDGCTQNAYHLYMLRYKPEQFANLPRAKFLTALSAEGIPCSPGYSPLNTESFIKETLHMRGYERIYSKERIAQWEERNKCPENDKLCQEAVWFTQTMFLGPRSDMDQIAEAIRKVQAHAGELAKV